MAARVRLKHLPYDRSKIQVGLLCKLLEQHAKGEIELSSTRLRAIEILLKKSMPDLISTEVKSESEHIHYYAELPRKDATAQDWSERVGPRGTAGTPAEPQDPTKH